jgi:hypothetical protein
VNIRGPDVKFIRKRRHFERSPRGEKSLFDLEGFSRSKF